VGEAENGLDLIHKYDLKNGLALVSFAISYTAFKKND
jgi:hypothetical protein